MALQLRSKGRTFSNPSFIHLFSTTSSKPSDTSDPNDESNSSSSSSSSSAQSSMSSYFSDVKASLRQTQRYSPPEPRRPSSSSSNRPFKPSKVDSFEEINKNLAEFRRRTSVPPPTKSNSTPSSPPGSSQHVSFQELYKQNVIGMAQNAEKSGGGRHTYDAIRETLNRVTSSGNAQNEKKGVDPMSLSTFKNTLKLKPTDSTSSPSPSSSPRMVFGGTDPSPVSSLFGEKKDKVRSNEMTEFVKMYSYGELGKKLKMLRPEAKGDDWFSLGELNDRLRKLRDMEEKEAESKNGSLLWYDLKDSLAKMQFCQDEKDKPKFHRIDILGHLGRTPEFMLQPPKEHLVETYFHPDNMSSAEKLKLELAKVRDEFKMSESDCGSARVQVAQLTTKIKHLSSVLHKKDKHSRKGLLAMVQRRKRLLKYLRRVDWESYCFVLNKLGLRDNPDYKH